MYPINLHYKREREDVTAGLECNCYWTYPDISHRVELCWMWERTLPFNPKALSSSHLFLCVLGETLNGIDQETARRPPETGPSSSCSFNTSGEQHSDHKVNSDILVNGTFSIKSGYIQSALVFSPSGSSKIIKPQLPKTVLVAFTKSFRIYNTRD